MLEARVVDLEEGPKHMDVDLIWYFTFGSCSGEQFHSPENRNPSGFMWRFVVGLLQPLDFVRQHQLGLNEAVEVGKSVGDFFRDKAIHQD